jgi:CubicO group peptidase (beta-lactamase class C family)
MITFPREKILEIFHRAHFERLAYSIIDFKTEKFVSEEWTKTNGLVEPSFNPSWFDLASISKILNGALTYFLKPQLFDEKLLWLLNHQAGLPAWAILSRDNWREYLESFEIKKSSTVYSDLSVLRLMLELEKKSWNMKKELSQFWKDDIVWWRDVPGLLVHDPNAKNISEFCSHAGLFSTIEKLSRFFIRYYQLTGGFKKISDELKAGYQDRFVFGFDRVIDPQNTLAGYGCSHQTIGHLGFVGTSVWIDLTKERALIILSDSALKYWYEKTCLNELRLALGQFTWNL